MSLPSSTYRLGIVSTYLPRRCGLATFTADLREALGIATQDTADVETVVVAIDRDGLTYGEEVVVTIDQHRIEDYVAAAHALREADVQAVLIQHEYGIFGGKNGAHLLELTRTLTAVGIPYLLTLHTVLSRPTKGQRTTLRALCAHAAKITVFTESARKVAVQTGIASGHQLVVVPHGAPIAMRSVPDPAKLSTEISDLLRRIEGKPTLTTFGLLSEGKGIDLAIDALADVVRVHPDTQYIVAGATHPEVRRLYGEKYRERITEDVHRLGLADNVHFVDAFLGLDELAAILQSSTLFVTPYRSPEQICSGALTFALGAGLPAVSSNYSYAADMLAGGAGRVVPCGDRDALARQLTELLSDPAALTAAKTVAESCAEWLQWPTVAARIAAHVREVITAEALSGVREKPAIVEAPALNLAHLDKLTDEIGVIQFALDEEPELGSGYCVDDVARLAIVAADLYTLGLAPASPRERWLRQSIRFLMAAYEPDGVMHNLLSYHGTWLDAPHLGDHFGRTVWALGTVVGSPSAPDDVRRSAGALLDEAVPYVAQLSEVGLRSTAYALIGLVRAGRTRQVPPLLHRLDRALKATGSADPAWCWYEPFLTYDNARLAQATLLGAAAVGNREATARALTALDWLGAHVGLTDGTLRNVGNLWHRQEEPERWPDDGDEQPLDAAAIAEAYVDAWNVTGDPTYAKHAARAFAWFLGRNRIGARLYVDSTGACHDGLSPNEANRNQGAESTLAYYQALLSLLKAGLAELPTVSQPAHRSAAPHFNRAPIGGSSVGRNTGIRSTNVTNVSGTQPSKRLSTRHRSRPTEGHTDAS
jgi:glycosyltransferase involved in cell wall biosynthesis